MQTREQQAEPTLSQILDSVVERAADDKPASFADLAAAAGLDPARDFIGASLVDVDLRDEDLRGFNFDRADLTGADFRRANVEGVSFDGAVLTGAIGLPPPNFDLDSVKQMILAGTAPPQAWMPFIRNLDFTDEPLADLSPLAGLSGLKILDLRHGFH
jgi:uncharacterized protein YjbI with pentapeptide repeats